MGGSVRFSFTVGGKDGVPYPVNKKLTTVAFTGAKGEKFASRATYSFIVPSDNTARIQETHITIAHVLCQMVEEILFEAPRKK